MSNIHLRGLDKQLISKLKQTALQENLSVNGLILSMIRQGLGLSQHRRRITYHDLDQLAGTWTTSDAKAFMTSIKDLEDIEKDLWK